MQRMLHLHYHVSLVEISNKCGLIILLLLRRIEKIVVIAALLNHPNDDKDDYIEKMLFKEEVADCPAYSWPMQSSVAVYN